MLFLFLVNLYNSEKKLVKTWRGHKNTKHQLVHRTTSWCFCLLLDGGARNRCFLGYKTTIIKGCHIGGNMFLVWNDFMLSVRFGEILTSNEITLSEESSASSTFSLTSSFFSVFCWCFMLARRLANQDFSFLKFTNLPQTTECCPMKTTVWLELEGHSSSSRHISPQSSVSDQAQHQFQNNSNSFKFTAAVLSSTVGSEEAFFVISVACWSFYQNDNFEGTSCLAKVLSSPPVSLCCPLQ